MLDVEAIHTYYGDSHVLHGVSLRVAPGEAVALLGSSSLTGQLLQVGGNALGIVAVSARLADNTQIDDSFFTCPIEDRLVVYLFTKFDDQELA